MDALHVVFGRGVRRGLFVALTCLGILACSASPEEEVSSVRAAIIGGQRVSAGEYPTVAWLDGGCSAVFVHPEVLLYAGHCGDSHRVAWLGDGVKLDEDDLTTIEDPLDSVAVDLAQCNVYPKTSYGTGTDLA